MLIFIFAATTVLYADTVVMKDRKKIKGLVVDEYVDRITLSTIGGERIILRDDIERIEYDTPEQNFMQLGRAYEEKGWYDKAAFYYKKAMEINPDYKEARDAYLASHAKIWRQEEKRTKKEMDHRNMVMDWWRNRNKNETQVPQDKSGLLKGMLGISLIEIDGIFTFSEVMADSSAGKAGIKEGDILVGIWGKLIRYSKIDDVILELLGPKHSEARVLVEKNVVIEVDDAAGRDVYKELGIQLGFEYEGLLIKDVQPGMKADLSGLKKGDFVITIDKHITRYLPLDTIISLINGSKNSRNINFTIRRSINLRRE